MSVCNSGDWVLLNKKDLPDRLFKYARVLHAQYHNSNASMLELYYGKEKRVLIISNRFIKHTVDPIMAQSALVLHLLSINE